MSVPDSASRKLGVAESELPADAGTRARRAARRRLFRRGPWEMAATLLIGAGVVMLMQPFLLTLYSWSFAVVLTGTLMFVVVSHFPD